MYQNQVIKSKENTWEHFSDLEVKEVFSSTKTNIIQNKIEMTAVFKISIHSPVPLKILRIKRQIRARDIG